MQHQRNTMLYICALITVLFLLGACATRQARKTQEAGFLGDYSPLKEGGDDQALLAYLNPQADIQLFRLFFNIFRAKHFLQAVQKSADTRRAIS